MSKKLIRTVMKAAALAGLILVGACNTVEGFGKDVERGGEKLQDAAK